MAAQDTPQQRAILRQCPTARRVRAKFPPGTEVRPYGQRLVIGKVVRHVPGTNAQGGYLVVEWPGGQTGRHSPISLELV